MNELKTIKKAIILYTAVTVIEQLLESKTLNTVHLDSERTVSKPKKATPRHQRDFW
jgi:hypothetical protein